MKTTLNSFRFLYVRQLIVAAAITGAAAAGATAVVLAERPVRIDPATKPATSELASGSEAADADRRPLTRSPKDAWRRLPPPWAPATAVPAQAPFDASVPAAGDVLGAEADPAGEPPTF